MKKALSLYLSISCILFFTSSCSQTENGLKNSLDSEDKPNIVLIITDDQTYTSIAALGNEIIKTPNMDRLVQGGTTFTHAYNMGGWNGAICAASRAMLQSGRTIWNANSFRKKWIAKDSIALEQTWAKLMEANGYNTYMTGKWHVDAHPDDIFQNVSHIRPGMPKDAWNHNEIMRQFKEVVDGKKVKPGDIMPIGYNRPKDENDNSWSPTDPKFGGFWEGGKHWSEVLKDDALSFIDKAINEENPYFMYLAFNAPHDPRQAPQEYIDMYPIENIEIPKNWLAEYPLKDKMGNGPFLRDEALAPFPRTEYATKKHIQEYYAIISHLDDQIGIILDKLENTGQLENTYIFFTADHGLAVGKHGLIGKQNQYDHSIRVPLIVNGPNIPAGQQISQDIYLQDIMPTSLEISNSSIPDYVEFKSFLGQAKGETEHVLHSQIYGAYINYQRMIRKEGYKLIIYPDADEILLFDMNEDPYEMNNLASNENESERVKSMFKDLIEEQKALGDQLNLLPMYENL